MKGADRGTRAKGQWVTCPCGKRGYPARVGAKKARQDTPSTGLSVYQCDRSDLWHIGHHVPGLPRTDYNPGSRRRGTDA